MPKLSYNIEGRTWLPISRAARLLGTNALAVRKLMGEGALEWRQTRANSKTLVVDQAGVLALRKQAPARLDRSPDPLARPPKAPRRRSNGGLTLNHHLRMTLPFPEGGKKKED